MKRIVLCLALVALLAGCIAPAAPGARPDTVEASFTVEAGQKQTVAVALEARRIVEGTFSVAGSEDTIDFYIRGPDRELAYGVIRAVGGGSFEFRAPASGAYTLYFDNSISFGVPRQVSLRYRTR